MILHIAVGGMDGTIHRLLGVVEDHQYVICREVGRFHLGIIGEVHVLLGDALTCSSISSSMRVLSRLTSKSLMYTPQPLPKACISLMRRNSMAMFSIVSWKSGKGYHHSSIYEYNDKRTAVQPSYLLHYTIIGPGSEIPDSVHFRTTDTQDARRCIDIRHAHVYNI